MRAWEHPPPGFSGTSDSFEFRCTRGQFRGVTSPPSAPEQSLSDVPERWGGCGRLARELVAASPHGGRLGRPVRPLAAGGYPAWSGVFAPSLGANPRHPCRGGGRLRRPVAATRGRCGTAGPSGGVAGGGRPPRWKLNESPFCRKSWVIFPFSLDTRLRFVDNPPGSPCVATL